MHYLIIRHPLGLLLAGFLVTVGLTAAGPVGPVFGRETVPDSTAVPVADEDVPYGVASGWAVGHQLLREGMTAEALPYLHMAYRAHPGVTAIALDFQSALAAEGYLKDATGVMDQLIAAHPDSTGFRMRRSSLYLSAGKTGKALEDLREIRRRGDASVEVMSAEASILAGKGDFDQALDVLHEGLALYPAAGRDIYLDMSRVLQQGKRSAEIPALMAAALAAYPDEPALWLVKIRALASHGSHDEALETAERADAHFAGLPAPGEPDAASVEPELAEAAPDRSASGDLPPDSFAVELADFYAQQRQVDRALAVLQPLAEKNELKLNPSLWLGRLLLGTGRQEEGAVAVERIIARWPEAGRGWFLKGKVYEGSGDWDAAIGHYQHAADLAPHDPEIRLGLLRGMLVAWETDLRTTAPNAEQAVRQEEFADQTMMTSTLVPEQDTEGQLLLGYAFRAIQDFERAAWRFKLAAENPDLRLTALIQKSICHDEIGQDNKARADLELLRHEYPDNAEVANSLGYFLAEKDQDLDLAEDLIEEALAASPGNGAFLDSMGWVLFRNGRLEEALDYMIKAVNVLPDDPVILEHLGMVLKGLGQTDEALDVLKRALVRGGEPERINAAIAEIEAAPRTAE